KACRRLRHGKDRAAYARGARPLAPPWQLGDGVVVVVQLDDRTGLDREIHELDVLRALDPEGLSRGGAESGCQHNDGVDIWRALATERRAIWVAVVEPGPVFGQVITDEQEVLPREEQRRTRRVMLAHVRHARDELPVVLGDRGCGERC